MMSSSINDRINALTKERWQPDNQANGLQGRRLRSLANLRKYKPAHEDPAPVSDLTAEQLTAFSAAARRDLARV